MIATHSGRQSMIIIKVGWDGMINKAEYCLLKLNGILAYTNAV